MSFRSKSALHIFLFILATLLLAHSPVLWSEFLRQDDWNAAWWNIDNLKSHGSFYNAVYELGRPVSAIFFLATDYFAHNLENAGYVRFVIIFLLAIASYLTYQWQIRLTPDKKIFAISFAIAFSTLAACQLQSSTVTYGFMVISTILGQIAAFYSAKLFDKTAADYSNKKRWKYYSIVTLCIVLGSMNYPPCTMSYFVFLGMYYLSKINSDSTNQRQALEFIIKSSALAFAAMVLYGVLIKIVYFVFQVVPADVSRSVHVDFDVVAKIKILISTIRESFDFFEIAYLLSFNEWYMFFITAALFLGCLFVNGRKKSIVKNLFHAAVVLGLIACSYSPMLVASPTGGSYRTMAAVMVLAFYIMMWSCDGLSSKYDRANLVPAFIACIAIFFCNHHLSRYIVGPHQHEMNYMRSYIENQVLKEVKDRKVTIHILRSNRLTYLEESVKISPREYQMAIELTHNWLISALTFLMREYGYESYNNNPAIKPHPFEVVQWNNEKGIYIKTTWGALVSTNSVDDIKVTDGSKVVVIDMNQLGTYR